jgi:hypothetical protein
VTKGVRLSATHSFLCADHELDLSVQAGVAAPPFASIFNMASQIVALLRNCKNLYRKLRDEQVSLIFLLTSIHNVFSFLTV